MDNLVTAKERTIYFINKVDNDSTKDIIEKIININNQDDELFDRLQQDVNLSIRLDRKNFVKPIKLIIGTFGGEVYSGLGLYDIIKNSKTPIEIECVGKIMSMGIILALASPFRVSHKNTTFMIHSVSGIALGQLKDLEDNVSECKRLNDILFNIIVENTSISRKMLNEIYEGKKDFFMNAEEALKYGLINKII